MGGQHGLVVKRPFGNQEVGGSNPIGALDRGGGVLILHAYVNFKKAHCGPVEFKKCSCRPVEFKKCPCPISLSF